MKNNKPNVYMMVNEDCVCAESVWTGYERKAYTNSVRGTQTSMCAKSSVMRWGVYEQ